MNFFERQRLRLTLPNGEPMTQQYIADQMGMTRAAVSVWERGTSAPRLQLVPKLAKVYGVSEKRVRDAIFEMCRPSEAVAS